MKVWVILCNYFDDTSIEEIHANEIKCDDRCRELNLKADKYHSYFIEDYEVIE